MQARRRLMVRVDILVLVVITWIMATLNGPWWSGVGAGRAWSNPANWWFIVACFVALVALHFVLIAPFSNRWTVRPLLTIIVITSAAAAHFMHNYSVMLDPTMIQNILKTDVREAKEFLSWSMAGWVLLWSALPLAFIWWVRIERAPWLRSLAVRAGTVAAAFMIALLSLLSISRDFSSLMRNEHELRFLVTPGNFIVGLISRSFHSARDANVPREPIGTDARMVQLVASEKPRVFVLVVGETARAVNFSLFGYDRPTTPELAKLGVLAFSNVTSCGTSTEVSVPCMFSPIGRINYDERRIRNSEGLLDVLVRAGYAVKWIDNQSGCKGVCVGAGIEYRKIDPKEAGDLCTGDECLDGVLVRRVETELAAVRTNTVIVLHMMGNHGPAYYRRYPPEFRRFIPDCETGELRSCSREQVVNAYDNAILYTDHVLAGIVRALASASALDTAMLYVSDHGESLGENGLYLHGLPYAIAPSFQKHVPMVAWISAGFAADHRVDEQCLRRKEADHLSHDNLFHSLLGVLDVKTQVYIAERDIFATCRGASPPSLARIPTER